MNAHTPVPEARYLASTEGREVTVYFCKSCGHKLYRPKAHGVSRWEHRNEFADWSMRGPLATGLQSA